MKHLTDELRYEISAYLKAGLSKPSIAFVLGVPKTRIYREIEDRLNNRPRKRYNFSTPYELFNCLTGKNQKVAFNI